MAAADRTRQRTIELTTRGRRSGQLRTARLWFVADGENRIAVQHVGRRPANWYWNLVRDPAVEVNFGDGPIAARATAIQQPVQIRAVLRRIRRKYWTAWLIQLLSLGATPRAAVISW
ncbi:MAG: nitroreductase family deazaflavin-dependent oxidoreductase [Candidatus Binatia bacterium]